MLELCFKLAKAKQILAVMQIQSKRRQRADTGFEKASRAALSEHRPSESTAGSSTLLLTEKRARNCLFAICQSKTLSESHLWVCAQLVLPQPLQAERQPSLGVMTTEKIIIMGKQINQTKRNAQSSCSTTQSVQEGYHAGGEQHLTDGS